MLLKKKSCTGVVFQLCSAVALSALCSQICEMPMPMQPLLLLVLARRAPLNNSAICMSEMI